MKDDIKKGDFTGLAKSYSQHRPDYSESVLRGLLGLLGKHVNDVEFVDIGAGTGIWTRMVYSAGVAKSIAIEPNPDMRESGIKDSAHTDIEWRAGSAEETGLPDCSADWITMASSFHWADTDRAMIEFHRVLRPGGRFSALWNPRLVEANPTLLEIEEHLNHIAPNLKRVSSGRSGIAQTLEDKLHSSLMYEDVLYLEGKHIIFMSTERYLGIWKSVNDVRVQLGEKKFTEFISHVEHKLEDMDVVEATYLTRAWSARRKE